MANLAEVWGWTPDKTGSLPLEDLIYWHGEMIARRPKDKG